MSWMAHPEFSIPAAIGSRDFFMAQYRVLFFFPREAGLCRVGGRELFCPRGIWLAQGRNIPQKPEQITCTATQSAVSFDGYDLTVTFLRIHYLLEKLYAAYGVSGM